VEEEQLSYCRICPAACGIVVTVDDLVAWIAERAAGTGG
jgi:hypothetical protein